LIFNIFWIVSDFRFELSIKFWIKLNKINTLMAIIKKFKH
jgi:hypothetical protein